MRCCFGVAALGALIAATPALAGEADVLAATASRQSDGAFRFEVTVRHADTGWDHYANAWQVVGPEGEILATRELVHPHTNEQPFTRSLSDVAIPSGVSRVTVRARDSVHGLGGASVELSLR